MSKFKVGDLITRNVPGFKGVYWEITEIITVGKVVYLKAGNSSVWLEQSCYQLYEGLDE